MQFYQAHRYAILIVKIFHSGKPNYYEINNSYLIYLYIILVLQVPIQQYNYYSLDLYLHCKIIMVSDKHS